MESINEVFHCSYDFINIVPSSSQANVYGVYLNGYLQAQCPSEVRLITGVVLPPGKRVTVLAQCSHNAPGFQFVDVAYTQIPADGIVLRFVGQGDFPSQLSYHTFIPFCQMIIQDWHPADQLTLVQHMSMLNLED